MLKSRKNTNYQYFSHASSGIKILCQVCWSYPLANGLKAPEGLLCHQAAALDREIFMRLHLRDAV
jgi:hypothetical protein